MQPRKMGANLGFLQGIWCVALGQDGLKFSSGNAVVF